MWNQVRKSMCRIKHVLTERALVEPDPRRSAEMKRMINALWWLKRDIYAHGCEKIAEKQISSKTWFIKSFACWWIITWFCLSLESMLAEILPSTYCSEPMKLRQTYYHYDNELDLQHVCGNNITIVRPIKK